MLLNVWVCGIVKGGLTNGNVKAARCSANNCVNAESPPTWPPTGAVVLGWGPAAFGGPAFDDEGVLAMLNAHVCTDKQQQTEVHKLELYCMQSALPGPSVAFRNF